MPDIQLRFHKDMLVLSAPLDASLARQGANPSRDRQYFNIMEPDVLRDALQLEAMAGAHCVVTTTDDITQARLAHLRMDADVQRLAHAALAIAHETRPQHILVEIGPCGLPLDASSKASLNENRAQYANAARVFSGESFDAFFLNGFTSIPDLKCALMGIAQVSGMPVFASVTVGTAHAPESDSAATPASSAHVGDSPTSPLPFSGYAFVDEPTSPPVPSASLAPLRPEDWEEAVDAMADLGASVVGFETSDPLAHALSYAESAAQRGLPVLAQLCVSPTDKTMARNLTPLSEIDEYTPDTMADAAVKLYGKGVQFLRATGAATPAFTGALAATVAGLDVLSR